MVKKRNEPKVDEDGDEVLIKASKQLTSSTKTSKDALIKTLKACQKVLGSASRKQKSIVSASGELCKALLKNDLLKHKDKEVRLYTAACVCRVLFLHAPETPLTDAQLVDFFQLAVMTFNDLADPAGPHFQLCNSMLETSAHIKLFLLALDLDSSSLVTDLFSTLLDVINADNVGLIEKNVLDILASMLDEGEDLPQPLMDVILGHLLSPARDENPTSYRTTQELLQRTQQKIQPSIQRFLTNLLDGARTDSEIAGSRSDLIIQLHRAAPQVMLPVIPHIQPGLQVESEERRLDTVDLVARLLTQPGGHELLADHPHLAEALLGRLNDRSPEVRQRVLTYAKGLVDACRDGSERRKIAEAVANRLQDPDEKLRSAAAAALCEIVADHPTAAKGAQYVALAQRLRDKRLAVRKEVAAQVGRLVRLWCQRHEEGGAAAGKELVLDLAMGLCNIACVSRDPELTSYILDDVFKNGVFPVKLSATATATWWSSLWNKLGDSGRPAVSTVLRNKCELQRLVRDVLKARNAVRQQQRLSLGQPSSSPGSKALTPLSPGITDPAAELQLRISTLAAALKDVSRGDEGLDKLFAMKDNNIFKALKTLATFGTPLDKTLDAAKEVQQRVGSKGLAAEVIKVLTARLMPTLVSPETLHAAMELAGENAEAHRLVMDIAAAAPQLFAQSLTQVLDLFEQDDPMLSECGASVLGAAGQYMLAHHSENDIELPSNLEDRLKELCMCASPSGAKAAVRALVFTMGATNAQPALREICDQLVTKLRDVTENTSHSEILSALKALSIAGRTMPAMYAEFVHDVYDIVVGDLMSMDLSAGRPLPKPNDAARGTKWGIPSPDVDIKAAALKTLAQSLVPDDPLTEPPEDCTEVALNLVPILAALAEPEPKAEQFAGFHWLMLRPQAEQEEDGKRAPKRRKRDALASPSSDTHGFSSEILSAGSPQAPAFVRKVHDKDDDKAWHELSEEKQAELIDEAEVNSPDVGWVRTSAGVALLRLARSYDNKMSGDDYLSIGLTCQEPVQEGRLLIMQKLHKAISYFLNRRGNPRHAAKYAALYGFFGGDPSPVNRQIAFTLLKEYSVARRLAAEKVAASAAAAGQSGSLINEMPEYLLPYLVYILANHPDYDRAAFETQVEIAQEAIKEGEEPDDVLVEARFHGMLQMVLETLILPHTSGAVNDAQEIGKCIAPTLKLLRQLKFCDVKDVVDVEATDEEATAKAHEICDIALYMSKSLAAKAAGHQHVHPGKFPGSLPLPKLCYQPRTNLTAQEKRTDGSDLPLGFHLHLREFYTKLYGNVGALPAVKGRGRTKPRTKHNDEEVEQYVAGAVRRTKPSVAVKRTKPSASRPPRSKPTQLKKVASPPKREQPGRGAKAAAQGRLKDDMELDSDGEEDEQSPRSSAEENRNGTNKSPLRGKKLTGNSRRTGSLSIDVE